MPTDQIDKPCLPVCAMRTKEKESLLTRIVNSFKRKPAPLPIMAVHIRASDLDSPDKFYLHKVRDLLQRGEAICLDIDHRPIEYGGDHKTFESFCTHVFTRMLDEFGLKIRDRVYIASSETSYYYVLMQISYSNATTDFCFEKFGLWTVFVDAKPKLLLSFYPS